jgi:hypothetical protein
VRLIEQDNSGKFTALALVGLALLFIVLACLGCRAEDKPRLNPRQDWTVGHKADESQPSLTRMVHGVELSIPVQRNPQVSIAVPVVHVVRILHTFRGRK